MTGLVGTVFFVMGFLKPNLSALALLAERALVKLDFNAAPSPELEGSLDTTFLSDL